MHDFVNFILINKGKCLTKEVEPHVSSKLRSPPTEDSSKFECYISHKLHPTY